jgi:hypothetical protein
MRTLGMGANLFEAGANRSLRTLFRSLRDFDISGLCPWNKVLFTQEISRTWHDGHPEIGQRKRIAMIEPSPFFDLLTHEGFLISPTFCILVPM